MTLQVIFIISITRFVTDVSRAHARETLIIILAQFVLLRLVHSSCFCRDEYAHEYSSGCAAMRDASVSHLTIFNFSRARSSYVHSPAHLRASDFPRARELWIFRSTFLSARTYAGLPSPRAARLIQLLPLLLAIASFLDTSSTAETSRLKETRSRTLTSASWILFDYHIFQFFITIACSIYAWGCFW